MQAPGFRISLPEGPYTLPLWNEALKDHPQYGFGDLIL